jgi:hypothetical protein
MAFLINRGGGIHRRRSGVGVVTPSNLRAEIINSRFWYIAEASDTSRSLPKRELLWFQRSMTWRERLLTWLTVKVINAALIARLQPHSLAYGGCGFSLQKFKTGGKQMKTHEGKEEEKDIMRELCIKQGYVPATCKMPGQMIFLLVWEKGDPCAGCNMDRAICKGRPKKY